MSELTVIEQLMVNSPNAGFFALASIVKKYKTSEFNSLVELYKHGNERSMLEFYRALTQSIGGRVFKQHISNFIHNWKSRGIELKDENIGNIVELLAEHVLEIKKNTYSHARDNAERIWFNKYEHAEIDTPEYRKFILKKGKELKGLVIYDKYLPGDGKIACNPWLWSADFDLSLATSQRKKDAISAYQSYFEKSDRDRIMLFTGISRRNIALNNKHGYLKEDADPEIVNNILNATTDFVMAQPAKVAEWYAQTHVHDLVSKPKCAFTKIATYVRKIISERDGFYLSTSMALRELTKDELKAIINVIQNNVKNKDRLGVILSDEFISDGLFSVFDDVNFTDIDSDKIMEMARVISITHTKSGFRKLLAEIK